MRSLILGLPMGQPVGFGVYLRVREGRPEVVWKAPRADGSVDFEGKPVHVLAYEHEHGWVPDGWDVHHVDHVVWNNEPANLVALPHGLHAYWHRVCRDAPAQYPGESVAWLWRTHVRVVWRRGCDLHGFRSAWPRMLLNLAPWLAEFFGAQELPFCVPAHLFELTPEARRAWRSCFDALALVESVERASSVFGSGSVSRSEHATS